MCLNRKIILHPRLYITTDKSNRSIVSRRNMKLIQIQSRLLQRDDKAKKLIHMISTFQCLDLPRYIFAINVTNEILETHRQKCWELRTRSTKMCPRQKLSKVSIIRSLYPPLPALSDERQQEAVCLFPFILLVIPVAGHAFHCSLALFDHVLQLFLLPLPGDGVWHFRKNEFFQ